MSNLELSRAERLDNYVISIYPELSRAFASRLVAAGKVEVNGQVVSKAGYKLRLTDTVVIDYVAAELIEYPKISLEIIYEDEDCVVINKPLGLLTHSKGAFNPEATVGTWLSMHLGNGTKASVVGDDMLKRAGIVHRLDRATSGVMICAKNAVALSWLQKQFSQRKVKKSYQAIVGGILKQPEAIIDMPIERNPKKPQMFRVGSNGKPSVTVYKVLKTTGDFSFLELKPETGRTHQLRVHLAELKHPIVGDTFYDGLSADRLYLHAHSLELTLPNRDRRTFRVPTPKAFMQFMAEHA